MDEQERSLFRQETDRIDKAEQAIVGLSGRMDGFDTRLSAVEADTSETKRGVHVLLQRTGGIEAQKGMIPIGQVWSAIGVILTMLTIGLGVLWNYDGRVEARIDNVVKAENSRHERVDMEMSLIREILELKIRSLEGHVQANEDRLDRKREMIAEIDETLARLEEKHEFTWEEIKDHEDEEDHPLRQTQDLKNLKERIDRMERREDTHR